MKQLTSGLLKNKSSCFSEIHLTRLQQDSKKTNCVSHPNGPIKIIITFLATLALGVRVVGLWWHYGMFELAPDPFYQIFGSLIVLHDHVHN